VDGSFRAAKNFYQGISNRCIPLSLKQLQLAGCCNFTREGIKAATLLTHHAGIDVTELVTSSAALLATLQNAGPEKIGDWVVSNGARASEDEALRLPKIMRVD